MADLAGQLDAGAVFHLPCKVSHARRGEIRHSFTYGVDFVLLAPGRAKGLALFSLDRFNLFSLFSRDNGGLRGSGSGTEWAWEVLHSAGLERLPGMTLALMTQPRFLGFWFNPVSFWLVLQGGDLRAVIAEVNNTFGQRHSYLCHLADFRPITPEDAITARKVFHVSPFQDVAGGYVFRFRVSQTRAAIQIAAEDGAQGLNAALAGAVQPATNLRLLAAGLRRPGGALRVVVLIFWNALRLKLKGAAYRPLPLPPEHEVSK